ncbi:MAG TPA: sigma-70 family RNA polymerase sigma factor [Williamsia sp.]
MTDISERDLVLRSQDGDQAAFGELVTRNRDQIWAVCLRITANKYDAEDALQDALIAGWQNIGKFRGDSKFTSWMYRIAANAALAVVRKRLDTSADGPPEFESTAPRVDAQVADVDRVRAALALLPLEFREAIVLREFGDLSYQEIADQQGVGVQTVKSRINRARAKLLETLS